MGRTEFTRTITATTIKSAKVSFKDGAVVTEAQEDIPVNGKIDDEGKAVEIVRKKYDKKAQYVITGLECVDTTYAISVEDLMKHGHVVEPKPLQAGK